MNKYIHYFGIDISKNVFDVMPSGGKYYQLTNNYMDFKQLSKTSLF